MGRYRGPRERPSTTAALLVALGAIGGLLIGAVVADRLGGLDGLRDRLGGTRIRTRRQRPDDDGAIPPHAADGDELEQRVLEAFRNDPMLAERAIDISADDADGVTLTGWVQDPAEQRYATVLARGVPGVRAVHSELAVAGE